MIPVVLVFPSGDNVTCDLSTYVFPFGYNANKDVQNKFRMSKRKIKTKDFDLDFYFFLLEDYPKTYGETMKLINVPFWKETCNNEINSLKKIKLGFYLILLMVLKLLGINKNLGKKIKNPWVYTQG